MQAIKDAFRVIKLPASCPCTRSKHERVKLKREAELRKVENQRKYLAELGEEKRRAYDEMRTLK